MPKFEQLMFDGNDDETGRLNKLKPVDQGIEKNTLLFPKF